MLALTLSTAVLLTLVAARIAHAAGQPRPALIARISRTVFGSRWRVAACVAHYESTDGAYTVNWPNLSPWQIDVDAHPWVDRTRILRDWWYAARVAYRISDGGRDWSAWSTHGLCGV